MARKHLGIGLPVAPDPAGWPAPAYHLLAPVHSLGVLSSFGCPFRCDYCASSLLSPSFIERNAEEVACEIARLVSITGASDVAFFDDAFLVHSDTRAKSLLRLLARRLPRLRLHFPNGLHARFIDQEIADLLCAANACTIRLALEGIGSRLRDRKVSRGDLASALERLERAGFDRSRVSVYLLVGIAGIPESEVLDSCDFVHSLGARIGLCEYSPIPGTLLADTLPRRSELAAEPLLANNKALAVWDVEDPFAALSRIKSCVRLLNRAL
ncbi:MAG: radical SAM protein [Planctomycetota bacterium]